MVVFKASSYPYIIGKAIPVYEINNKFLNKDYVKYDSIKKAVYF